MDLTSPLIIEPIDVLNCTHNAWHDIKETKRTALRLRCCDLRAITTQAELIQRVLEYIQIQSLNFIPTRLVSLNRRFGSLAIKLGTTTLSIIGDLSERGYLKELTRGRINIYCSMAVYKELYDDVFSDPAAIDGLFRQAE